MSDDHEFHTFRGYQLLRQENSAVLSPSQEDYMEMIYRQSRVDEYVRVNRLAEQLNVAAPSVTRSLKKLASLGFIKYSRYGYVTLTDKGKVVGTFLLDRHDSVELFLRLIGVKESRFMETELIEHHISHETLLVIKKWISFFERHPEVLSRFQCFTDNS